MKTKIKLIMTLPLLVFIIGCNAQSKNTKNITVKIDGNCGMCEKTIESAAFKKNVSSADWDKDTKLASLSFDENKTNEDELLKLIAYAGYDNEKYLAPDDVYAKLPGCCQYERTRKQAPKNNDANIAITSTKDSVIVIETVTVNPFKEVFESYIDLKDAFIKAENKTAATKATELSLLLKNIDITKLESSQQEVWKKNNKDLISLAEKIATSKNIDGQRKSFSSLSDKIHDVIKIAKLETTVYYQHCPMYNGGANWLSLDNTIKNPYYGSQMLTCGKTIETIKQ